jgi:hypothetical protein
MRKIIFCVGLVLILGVLWLSKNGWWVRTSESRWLSSFRQALKISNAGKLRLTDEQHRLLWANRAPYRMINAQIDAAVEVKKAEIENELEKPAPNQKKLTLLCQKLGKLYGEKMKCKIHYVMKVDRNILTPAQLTTLEDSPDSKSDPLVNVALVN